MPNSIRRSRRDGAPIIWFLLFSLFLNVAAGVAGFWIHLPTNSTPIMLTDSREAAIANAWSHELETVSVH